MQQAQSSYHDTAKTAPPLKDLIETDANGPVLIGTVPSPRQDPQGDAVQLRAGVALLQCRTADTMRCFAVRGRCELHSVSNNETVCF
jgi:hypothetical protein